MRPVRRPRGPSPGDLTLPSDPAVTPQPYEDLRAALGDPKLDPELLELALTHRSYAYENGGLPTNERLEFLGDSVLGVVITMGSIGGTAQEIGKKVAAALVGTFVGILLAYGVFAPLAQACESIVRCEGTYLACIKTAILSFARGDAPITVTEFARRNIEPGMRPSFTEMEETINALKGAIG